jgi:hypothetical protein
MESRPSLLEARDSSSKESLPGGWSWVALLDAMDEEVDVVNAIVEMRIGRTSFAPWQEVVVVLQVSLLS